MKKKIKKIIIRRDSDDELLLEVYKNKKVEILTSTNSIDNIIEIISDILYEANIDGSTDNIPSAGTNGCFYKLTNLN